MNRNIKLIATDIDGTLVKDSSPEIYPEMIEQIKRLVAKNILFTVASGRQYESIRSMFHQVAEEIIYIAENGALIRRGLENLSVIPMNYDYAVAIIQQLREYKDTCDFIVSTPDGSFLETQNKEFIDLIQYSYRNKFFLVEDILNEDIEIIKIAVYQKGSIRALGEKVFIPQWQNKVKTCMAGEEWVDFMDASVDKGNAIQFLQKYYEILPEETMTFGDNDNDIGMMKAAKYSYAVENALPGVKEAANYLCDSYVNMGVVKIIEQI